MKFDFFKTKIFTDWFNEALEHSNNTVMDPFAGTNTLIKELLKIREFKHTSYDIHPRNADVLQKDTLKAFPKNFNLIITNPPFLTAEEAKKQNMPAPSTRHDDLYKTCLDLILNNAEYAGTIVPISIFESNDFAWMNFLTRRIKYVIPLDQEWTKNQGTDVVLILFAPAINND